MYLYSHFDFSKHSLYLLTLWQNTQQAPNICKAVSFSSTIGKPSNISWQFDRWVNWSTEELNHLPKLRKLIRGWARHRSHISRLLDLYSSPTCHSHSLNGYSESRTTQDTLQRSSHSKCTTVRRWFAWTLSFSYRWRIETHDNLGNMSKIPHESQPGFEFQTACNGT